jgi:hypothetical protein
MDASLETAVLDRVLDPVTEILTPPVALGIANMRADSQLQARLDELADKANDGRLSEEEQREYRDYIDAIDLLGVLQSKARQALARSQPI